MNTGKLGDLVRITIGRTPSRSNSDLWDKKRETANVWLSIADLLNTEGKIVSDSKEYVTDVAAGAFDIVPNGTLLVSFKLTLGRLAFAGQDLRTNEAIAALRNDESKILNEYLYYFLSHFDWMSYAAADKKVKGFTLNKAKLHEIEISYPESLEEQRRIVAKLDVAFEKIDWTINLTNSNIENADFFYISTRRRTFEEFSGNNIKTLNDIGVNLDNRRIPITKGKRTLGSYPYYGASGIVDYVDNYIFDKDLLLISEDGANLLARSTPIAFVASGKYWVNNHAHIYDFSERVTMRYVEYYLENTNLTPYVTGAAQPKLSQGSLAKIPIAIPNLETQSRVVDVISDAQVTSQKLVKSYKAKLNYLYSLKRSMLNQAFSESAVK